MNNRNWILRTSVPAIAAAAGVPSPQRRSSSRLAQLRGRWRGLLARFMTSLFGIVLFAQVCALPTHLGFFFLPLDAHAMTKGCKRKTCCTALCYVDKYGIHHCVHEPGGDSCECSKSSYDSSTNPILLSTVVALPDREHLLPAIVPAGWTFQTTRLIADYDPATPSPPPK